jgi:uncharacterized protein (TIGR01777 family)
MPTTPGRIVVTGATGFLGRPLVDALIRDGYQITVLSRQAGGAPSSDLRRLQWTPDGSTGPWASALDGAHAVINLAGESIADTRWTDAQKRKIIDSRVLATRSLVAAVRQASNPPAVFANGSAVGYYGPRGDEIITEDHAPGTDFLAEVCKQWEAEAKTVTQPNVRLVFLRTGLVLEKEGGALPRMLLPFKLGAGGPVGTGRQYWPWIHRRDWIDLVRWAIRTPAAVGPLNLTAPEPVTNAAFAAALGRVMHRPAFMPAPGFALRLLLGEMADGLLLSGQRAVPRLADDHGFSFSFTTVDDALRAILR